MVLVKNEHNVGPDCTPAKEPHFAHHDAGTHYSYLVSLSAIQALEPIANIAEGRSRVYDRHEQSRIEVFRSWYHGAAVQQRRHIASKHHVMVKRRFNPFVSWGEGCRPVVQE